MFFRDDRNYEGSDRHECITRRLISQGHNLAEDGRPSKNAGCDPCNDSLCCSMLGPECGCGTEDCVDYSRERFVVDKPAVRVTGEDGNVFNILGVCRRALRQAGQEDQIALMTERVTKSSSYVEALAVMQEFVIFE